MYVATVYDFVVDNYRLYVNAILVDYMFDSITRRYLARLRSDVLESIHVMAMDKL